MLYADDIVLLSASCRGLKEMINTCKVMGYMGYALCCLISQRVSLSFLLDKIHVVFHLVLNGNPIPWLTEWNILVCNFAATGYTELTDFYGKFHGQFNLILSEFGKCSNEMTGVQLIKTYCLPTLMCGCEVWSLTNSSLYTMSGIIVSDEFLHCALAALLRRSVF